MKRDIESYTKEYLNAPFEDTIARFRRKNMLELIADIPHERVLEIGCGMDSIGNELAGMSEITIVEPSEAFLDKARSDAEGWAGVNARFIPGFFEERADTLSQYGYDLIIISSLLHEVPSPVEFMKCVKALCLTDTVVHVNVPNALSLHRLLALESGLIESLETMSERNISLQQNCVFTLETLQKTLEGAGRIEVLSKGSFFVKPFTHKQMERCLKEGIFGEDVLRGFDGLIKYMPDHGADIYINFRFAQRQLGSARI